MSAFRGTFLALGTLIVLWLVMGLFEGSDISGSARSVEVSLYSFEKESVISVEIQRPDDTISIAEIEDGWVLTDSSHRASRTMIGRIKHQLHDLTARATVTEDSADLDRYGLGSRGVRVTVGLRSGEELSFIAGDENPTGVSHYIMPLPGNTVYTVKKSAIDFLRLEASHFREAKFASFDTALVDQISVNIVGIEERLFQRGGVVDSPEWSIVTPVAMSVATDTVRGLIGRVTQLRAETFEAEIDPVAAHELEPFGFTNPRARLSFASSDREPVVLIVGSPASDSIDETLAYMMLEGEPSVFVARDALLDDFSSPIDSLRNMSFVGIDKSNVSQISVMIGVGPNSDEGELHGSATIMSTLDSWVWGDGAPVSGSTPDRVATRTTMAEGLGFVSETDPVEGSLYGFDEPLASVVITESEGQVSRLLVGGEAEPGEGLEGRASPRWYAGLEGQDGVYLVGDHLVSALKDLIREHNRKLSRDEAHLDMSPSVEVDN